MSYASYFQVADLCGVSYVSVIWFSAEHRLRDEMVMLGGNVLPSVMP